VELQIVIESTLQPEANLKRYSQRVIVQEGMTHRMRT
jgi:hypothetical protein